MLPMTAPILQEKANGKYRISLPLPSLYTLPALPSLWTSGKTAGHPGSTDGRHLVYRDLGQEQYSVQLAKLFDWMRRNGLKGAGEPVYARYDSSYLWFLRRNEVLIP